MDELITPELLKSWGPCVPGYRRFLELFPQGATLSTAIEGLVADGHDAWGRWLFKACQDRGICTDITTRGYRNSGDRNSGNCNSGNWNNGDWNSGDWNSGDRNSGDSNSGDRNSGDWNSGNCNSGDWNSGDRNSGDRNSGDRNSGDRNSGDWNSGNWNSGDWNSGDRNSGYRNSGDRNSGNCNSGDWNSGDRNSGDWNSGDWNSGYFNTDTPSVIRVFGKDCDVAVWKRSYLPKFLYFNQTEWVSSDALSEQEKLEYPEHAITGGILRRYEFKEAFRLSWERADPEDRIRIKELPNFDAEIFFQISGIDLREEAL